MHNFEPLADELMTTDDQLKAIATTKLFRYIAGKGTNAAPSGTSVNTYSICVFRRGHCNKRRIYV